MIAMVTNVNGMSAMAATRATPFTTTSAVGITHMTIVYKKPNSKGVIEFFDCAVCRLPYPTTGKFTRNEKEMCANCNVQNKRFFKEC